MRHDVWWAPSLLLVVSGALALPAAAAAGGQAQPAATTAAAGDEVGELRRELETLRQDYASRIAALEARLQSLEAAGATAAAPAPAPEPVPSPAPPAAGASKMFNPDISAIGNFVGVAGPSPGSGEPSLNMQEAELAFQAVVDPYARADFFVTLGPDEVALEEGYITFPTLPGGLLDEGREDARRVRQDERAASAHAAVRRSAARHDEPHWAARTASRTPASRSPA